MRVGDILVDARGLEPPVPLERVLDALDRRAPGQRVCLLLHREPLPLYPLLAQMGLAYRARLLPDGSYEILIHEPRGP